MNKLYKFIIFPIFAGISCIFIFNELYNSEIILLWLFLFLVFEYSNIFLNKEIFKHHISIRKFLCTKYCWKIFNIKNFFKKLISFIVTLCLSFLLYYIFISDWFKLIPEIINLPILWYTNIKILTLFCIIIIFVFIDSFLQKKI